MEIFGRKRLDMFRLRHANSRVAIDQWLGIAESAEWQTPSDVRDRLPNVDFLPDNRLIFNLGGNKYRLVAHISYKNQTIMVERIGTHSEYDRWTLGD